MSILSGLVLASELDSALEENAALRARVRDLEEAQGELLDAIDGASREVAYARP